jgi:SAM-dependent methyltransferase
MTASALRVMRSAQRPSMWPLPALLCWGVAWGVFALLAAVGAPVLLSLTLATALGGIGALLVGTPWRRLCMAAGFPLSLAASGLVGSLPGWAWLLPLAALLVIYPWSAWRDAPLFPTPAGALQGLAEAVPLPAHARVLDAGCGLGDALIELHAAYPSASVVGIESSWPLRWASAWRCRFARVRHADMWRHDWSSFDLVYLFQRPESMARAATKARAELRSGAWLASLEFEIATLRPQHVHACADGRRLWLYKVPFTSR